MLRDRHLDHPAGLVPEPGLQDRGIGPAIRGDSVDHKLIVERDDIGAPDAGDGRHGTDPMEPAPERDAATVPGPTARRDPPRDVGLMAEMLAQPPLALGEERGSSALMLRADRPCRDRDDDASIRVDDDPQHASTGRPS
jgi:hypothetical protein